MDTLLNPDTGLVIWTIISFLVLVGLLKAFAWGPLLGAIEEREAGMRREREQAEAARKDAERIRQELEKRMASIESQAQELLAKAGKEGEALREGMRKTAESESQKLVEKTRAQLEDEKNRLVGELRREVAALSVQAAERLVRKSVDAEVRKSVLDRFLEEIGRKGS